MSGAAARTGKKNCKLSRNLEKWRVLVGVLKITTNSELVTRK